MEAYLIVIMIITPAVLMVGSVLGFVFGPDLCNKCCGKGSCDLD
jgi:hypothetical protein